MLPFLCGFPVWLRVVKPGFRDGEFTKNRSDIACNGRSGGTQSSFVGIFGSFHSSAIVSEIPYTCKNNGLRLICVESHNRFFDKRNITIEEDGSLRE